MRARAARHGFFRSLLATTHAQAVALAHHQNDQAETLLLRLARGTSRTGLRGMRFRTELPGLTLVRPLLHLPKAKILAWLNRHDLKWREDLSNRDPVHRRNRVRHEILPRMQAALNPKLVPALFRLAEVLNDEEALLEKHTRRALAELIDQTGSVDGSRLHVLTPALQRRTLKKWLPGTADFEHIEAIRRGETAVDLPGGQRVRQSQGRIFLESETVDAPATRLNLSGETQWQSWCISVTEGEGILRSAGRPGTSPDAASIRTPSADEPPLNVRAWQEGDEMRPWGMNGRKKLSDIFIDAKVPVYQRKQIPVLVCGEEIIWLVGYRIATHWTRHPGSIGLQLHAAELDEVQLQCLKS